jgi:hypothetical protein
MVDSIVRGVPADAFVTRSQDLEAERNPSPNSSPQPKPQRRSFRSTRPRSKIIWQTMRQALDDEEAAERPELIARSGV